jgi:hypothetical protein
MPCRCSREYARTLGNREAIIDRWAMKHGIPGTRGSSGNEESAIYGIHEGLKCPNPSLSAKLLTTHNLITRISRNRDSPRSFPCLILAASVNLSAVPPSEFSARGQDAVTCIAHFGRTTRIDGGKGLLATAIVRVRVHDCQLPIARYQIGASDLLIPHSGSAVS